MRSMPHALLWEMFAGGWWSLTGMTLMSCLIPMLVHAEMMKLQVDASDPAMVLLQLAFIPLVIIQAAIGVLIAQRRTSRLYAMPISTHAIVAWHTFAGAAVLALLVAIVSWLLNALFGANWPIGSTVLFSIAVWSSMQLLASVSTQQSLPGLCFAGTPLLLLFVWLPSRYGAYSPPPTHYWSGVTAGEFVFLATITIFCLVVTNYSTRWARCGERLPVIGLWNWIVAKRDAMASRVEVRPRFSSASAAQFWSEWRQKGLILPGTFFVVLSIGFLAGVQRWVQSNFQLAEVYEGVFAFGSFQLMLAAIAGFVLAMDFNSEAAGQRETQLGDSLDGSNYEVMGSFQASRPVETREFAFVLLRVAGVSIAITWLMWFAAACGCLGLMWLSNQLPSNYLAVKQPWGYLAIMVVGPWTLMANAATLGLIAIRHKRLAYVAVATVVCYLVAAAVLHDSNVPKPIQTLVHSVVIGLIALAVTLVSVWSFWQAYRSRFLSLRAVATAVLVTAVVFAIGIGVQPAELTVVEFLVLIGFAVLTVSPVASLPILIAANRHR